MKRLLKWLAEKTGCSLVLIGGALLVMSGRTWVVVFKDISEFARKKQAECANPTPSQPTGGV